MFAGTSRIGVLSRGPGRLDVFGLGADDQMFHRSFDGNRWTPDNGWEGLGGRFITPPSAVSWGANRLDVFGLGTDKQMFHRFFDGNQWSPANGWEGLGGIFDPLLALA